MVSICSQNIVDLTQLSLLSNEGMLSVRFSMILKRPLIIQVGMIADGAQTAVLPFRPKHKYFRLCYWADEKT